MRDNNTNNYAETLFKQIKDTHLKRTRLYNPVELLDFFSKGFIEVYVKKLMDYVLGFRHETKKADKTIAIESAADGIAILIDSGAKVSFDLLNGYCQCPIGKEGASCTHSIFLSSLNYWVPNEICSHLKEVKQHLFRVAKGEEPGEEILSNLHTSDGQCPSMTFVAEPVHEFIPSPDAIIDDFATNTVSQENEFATNPVTQDNENLSTNEPQQSPNDDSDIEINLSEELKKACDALVGLSSDKEMKKAILNFNKFIQTNIKKPTGRAKIVDALKNLDSKPINNKMRVQQDSIVRRSCGQTTTTSLTPGRYKNNSFIKARKVAKKAKKHNIQIAIDNDTQNGGHF